MRKITRGGLFDLRKKEKKFMAESTNPVNRTVDIRARQKGTDLSTHVFGKVQPQATALEEAVLGAIMLDKDALPVVLDILQIESFYSEAHQSVYRAMLALFE